MGRTADTGKKNAVLVDKKKSSHEYLGRKPLGPDRPATRRRGKRNSSTNKTGGTERKTGGKSRWLGRYPTKEEENILDNVQGKSSKRNKGSGNRSGSRKPRTKRTPERASVGNLAHREKGSSTSIPSCWG